MNYREPNQLKVKLIVGFRRDQEHSIDADEAHKAYYLFLHPEERGVFNNGLAIKGDQIQEIVPDFQGTMGWNPTHNLDSDDWNELRGLEAIRTLQKMMSAAKEIAQISDKADFQVPLSELIEQKYPALMPPIVERRDGEMKRIEDIMKHDY